jgi:3-methyladenine DNA glycosylase AlkD
LFRQSDAKTRDWWTGYVKDSAPFLGVKMSAIRAALHLWHEEHIAAKVALAQQMDVALALFGGDYSEEKLAGTLFLAELLLPVGAIVFDRDLARFAHLFEAGLIYDWNVCDWFCAKVLGPLIQREGTPCASKIAKWRSAQNVWQARASVVAFVKVADEPDHRALIEASCRTLIRREERFAKTAVGWVLREVSKQDVGFVKQFVDEHHPLFSRESLDNAIKYLDPSERKRYRKLLKEAHLGT